LVTTFNSISDIGFVAAYVKRVLEGREVDDSSPALVRSFHHGPLELTVFFGLKALFGEPTKHDIRYFKDIIHPGQMWDHISNEMKRK